MDLVTDFLTWAWPRHLNPLSWYIRPLFFLPIAWFCWTRRGGWLTVSIVAMLSSFFWFPAPAPGDVDPSMQAVLDMEEQLFADPTWVTWVSLFLIPVLLVSLYAAFWNRSLGWGLVVVNGGLATKIGWVTVNSGLDGFVATIVPLGAAMLVITALVVALARWRHLPLALVRRDRHRDGVLPDETRGASKGAVQ